MTPAGTSSSRSIMASPSSWSSPRPYKAGWDRGSPVTGGIVDRGSASVGDLERPTIPATPVVVVPRVCREEPPRPGTEAGEAERDARAMEHRRPRRPVSGAVAKGEPHPPAPGLAALDRGGDRDLDPARPPCGGCAGHDGPNRRSGPGHVQCAGGRAGGVAFVTGVVHGQLVRARVERAT